METHNMKCNAIISDYFRVSLNNAINYCVFFLVKAFRSFDR